MTSTYGVISGRRRSEDYDNLRQVASVRRDASPAMLDLTRLVGNGADVLHAPCKSVTMRVTKKTTTLLRGQQKTRLENTVETMDGHVFMPMPPQQLQVREKFTFPSSFSPVQWCLAAPFPCQSCFLARSKEINIGWRWTALR